LGLIVDLSRVVLTVTADPAGGILGQLLCSLTGGGTLQQIVTSCTRSSPSSKG
jgi:hypothetical protein